MPPPLPRSPGVPPPGKGRDFISIQQTGRRCRSSRRRRRRRSSSSCHCCGSTNQNAPPACSTCGARATRHDEILPMLLLLPVAVDYKTRLSRRRLLLYVFDCAVGCCYCCCVVRRPKNERTNERTNEEEEMTDRIRDRGYDMATASSSSSSSSSFVNDYNNNNNAAAATSADEDPNEADRRFSLRYKFNLTDFEKSQEIMKELLNGMCCVLSRC